MAVSKVTLRSTHLDPRLRTSVMTVTLSVVVLPLRVAMMDDGVHGHHFAKVRNYGMIQLRRVGNSALG